MEYIESIALELVKLKEQAQLIAAQKKIAEAKLVEAVSKDFAPQFNDDYGTGTAKGQFGKYQVKMIIKKKIGYDQQGLRQFCQQLPELGYDPDDMVSIKLDINETKYKNWPAPLKAMVEAYRTVEPSKPTIEVEIK